MYCNPGTAGNDVKQDSGDWYVAVDSCVLSRLELDDLGLQKPSFKSSSSDLAALLFPQSDLPINATAAASFETLDCTVVVIVLCKSTPFFGG